MKLYIMDNGWNENDLACLVAMPHQATAADKNPPAEWVKAPVYTALIEHPDGLVLFDTACHPDTPTRWPAAQFAATPHYCREDQRLLNTLKRLGYTPDDIDIVVASHLHEDHGGNLEYFTKSRIIVHETEFTETMKNYGLGQDEGPYIRKDIAHWIDAKLHWELVAADQEDFELLPGIRVINLGPGHVPGMLALMVSLPNTGNVILASDAVNTRVNLGPPIRLPGIPYDSIGFVNTIKKIHKLQKEYNAQVWCGHDAEQFDTLIKSDQGYYD